MRLCDRACGHHSRTSANSCNAPVKCYLSLIQSGVSAEAVGVIAPYRAQVRLLRETLGWRMERARVKWGLKAKVGCGSVFKFYMFPKYC